MPKRIILAEDDEIARECYTDNLREFLKLDVDGVPNGEELVERVRTNKYNLVITDNNMGNGISGLEAIANIRQFNSTIPVFMLSGDDVKTLALKAGATGYIDKWELAKFGIEVVIISEIKPYL